MTTKTGRKSAKPTKTPEQRAAELAEAHDMIVKAVEEITSADAWRRWLTTMSAFHTYSFNNVILLHVQCAQRGMPAPTKVAGFKTWLKINRGVRKGERALKVYAPILVKRVPGDPGYTPERDTKKIVGFRLAPVFDVSQTDGEPLPKIEHPEFPPGEAPAGLWDALVDYATKIGSRVSYADTSPAEGDTDPVTHAIRVHEQHAGTAQACAILAHEIAHAMLHIDADDEGVRFDYRAHRGLAETEAESVAFLIMTHFGVDVGATSFDYVAGWAKDADLVIKTGQRVQATAKKIIEGMSFSRDDNEGETLF